MNEESKGEDDDAVEDINASESSSRRRSTRTRREPDRFVDFVSSPVSRRSSARRQTQSPSVQRDMRSVSRSDPIAATTSQNSSRRLKRRKDEEGNDEGGEDDRDRNKRKRKKKTIEEECEERMEGDQPPTRKNASTPRARVRRRISPRDECEHEEDIEDERVQGRKRIRQYLFGSESDDEENDDDGMMSTPKTVRKQRSIEKRRQREIKRERDRDRYKKQKKDDGIFPKWCTVVDVGRLVVRCKYCLALFFKNEVQRCCLQGAIKLEEPREPFEPLKELLDGRTEMARKHFPYIYKLNTLFSFGARQCTTINIPGRGVPITKIQGSIAHTASAVYAGQGRPPAFGSVYALEDATEAAEHRTQNKRLSDGIDHTLIGLLSGAFAESNRLAHTYRMMSSVLHEQEKNHIAVGSTTFRIVPRAEIMQRPDLEKYVKDDHIGTFNTADSTMALMLYHQDDLGRPMLPKGLNVYPYHSQVGDNLIQYFDPVIDPMTYPFIHPFGEIDFRNSSIKKIPKAERKKYSEEEIQRIDKEDLSDNSLNGEFSEASSGEDTSDGECDDQSIDTKALSEEDSDVAANGDDDEDSLHSERLTDGEDDEDGRILREVDDSLPQDPPIVVDGDLPVLPQPRPDPVEEEEGGEGACDDMEDDSNSEEEVEEADGEEDGDGEDEGDGRPKRKKTGYVSALEHLAYRSARRVKSKRKHHMIWSVPRVSQMYLIDKMNRVHAQRAYHIQQHYEQTKKSKQKAFLEAMAKPAEDRGRRLGMTVHVPQAVTGSPAYLRAKYEDTMSMVAALGRPDLFITFTGNRQWPEIKRYQRRGHTWADTGDIAVRAFDHRLRILLHLIKKKHIFGKVAGIAYSIELQQRGMPHAHILLILDKESKLETPQAVDKHVWAHLPDPESETDEKKKEQLKKLRALVEKHMIHTPCEDNEDSYCRVSHKAKKKAYRRCSKGFPKEFSDQTNFVDDGYVLPRRPNDGVTCEKMLRDSQGCRTVVADNRHVVCYNPYLLYMFDSHINVEVCSTVKACKYIYKYIFKGADKSLVEFIERSRVSDGTPGGKPTVAGLVSCGHLVLPAKLSKNIPKVKKKALEREARKRLEKNDIPLVDENGKKTLVYDETVILQAMRTMTVSEALLGMYKIRMAYLSHSIVRLGVHEPNQESVYWTAGYEEEKERALKNGTKPVSRLTGWFELNRHCPEARSLTYLQVPLEYKWYKGAWVKRKKKTKVLTRLYEVMPKHAEKFALRMLIFVVRGATSFEALRTLEDGTVCDTFVQAARMRGLMDDEKEWEHAMREAVQTKMPVMIRRLFASIIVYCPVKDKQRLFDMFAEEMYDRGSASKETKRARALFHIESILKNNAVSNEVVGLEQWNEDDLNWSVSERRRNDESIGEEVTMQEAEVKAKASYDKMNAGQRRAFLRILQSMEDDSNRRCFFVDGPGGTGKTFLYKAVYYGAVAMGKKVLMVAHTGIAATLLVNGSTVHRQFCIPIGVDGEQQCQVDPGSMWDERIREAEVIVWDEACMSDRRVFEAVEKYLNEHDPTGGLPFGGKFVLLGGDWKQLLPVVKNTFGVEILQYTIKESPLWKHFQILKLTENMRVEAGAQEFAELLDKIGRQDDEVHEDHCYAVMPQEIMARTEDEVLQWAYGGGILDPDSAEAIKDTAVLTTLNMHALAMNEKVLEMLPGEEKVLRSVDTCSRANRYLAMPVETYNNQTPNGMPPHELKLKKGCVIVLLRNLQVSKGLCNGTRMRVREIHNHTLDVEVITEGEHAGYRCLLEKVEMEPSDTTDPSTLFKRLQFPVRLAYVMTINKSQGQTLKKVGIVLHTPAFSHGQMYVAMSRARTLEGVKIWCKEGDEEREREIEAGRMEPSNKVLNIVFRQILH